MKKKGLIVATIVMVLVLAVSLTTATYAWFTTSASTEIQGFNVSVSAGNVLNIGLSTNNTYIEGAGADSFVSGDCVYTSTTPGTLQGGWAGSIESLSATISHTINWGDVDKAVGFSKATGVDTDPKAAKIGDTGLITQAGWLRAVKANGDTTKFTSDAEYAVANGDTSASVEGDFVYLFMGAQPTKALAAGTNKVYVVVQAAGSGQTLGMAAAIHVAYKVYPSGTTDEDAALITWTDAQPFGADGTVTHKSTKNSYSQELPWKITDDQKNETGATQVTETASTIPNAKAVVIPLSDWAGTGEAPLDQFEIVVYLAGADADCIDAAKNGLVKIFIYFGAQAAVTA